MAFKIADGYVSVHGRIDDPSFRRAAERAGDRAGGHFTTAFGRSMTRRHARMNSIFRDLLTPDPDLMRTLLHPLERTLSIPIVAAISAGIVGFGASMIAAAIQSAVLLAVGGGVLGLGAAILLGTEKMQKKAAEDHLKRIKKSSAAELKDMRATLRARITSMREAGASEDAIRRVRVAGEAAIARKVLENDAKIRAAGKATSQTLTKAFTDAGKRIMEVLSRAAAPLVGPFQKALKQVVGQVEELEPQFQAMFAAAAPILPLLVETLGAFAEAILPAIVKMMPSVVKMFEILAARAPELADAVADLLLAMAQPETLEAFTTLLTIMIGAIRIASAALGALTRAFNRDVRDIKHGAELASGAIRAIPKTWRTVMRFLGGGGAVGWALRVTGATRAIPRAWRTVMRFLGGGGAIGWILRVTGAIRRIPRSWRTSFRFVVGSAIRAIRSLIGWISRIPRNVVTNITQSITRLINPFARATGGLVGAQGMAGGGISGGRPVLVGEQGPELVDLPFGSRVVPSGQSRAQMGAPSGGGQPIVIHLSLGTREFASLLINPMRKEIRSLGGDVQAVLGT